MLNENLNNDFQWQNKLCEIESLPENNFNKELAWNKLHKRLHKKASQKKAFWYWMAAAVFFIATSVVLFTWYSNKQEVLNNENFVKDVKKKDPKSNLKTDDKYSDNSGSVLITDKIIAGNKLKQKSKIASSDKPLNNIRLTDTVSYLLSDENFIKSLQKIDTFSSTVINIPQKKKLKVVHINEIGESIETISAHNTEIHSFQFKLANQQVFVNTSVSSKVKDIAILKIKYSSN